MFSDRHILLGVTGGIAAYKSAELVRRLTEAGAEVRVVMTEAATRFVAPLTFQALSGHRCGWRCSMSKPRRAWATSSWPAGSTR